MKNFANEVLGIDYERTKNIFMGAILGLFLSKGLSLVPGYSVDDYVSLNQGRGLLSFIGQGRYSDAAIQLALNNLGISSTAIAWPTTLLCLMVAALAITLGIVFATRGKGSATPQAVIAAIIGSYPFLTEYFSFREGMTFIATGFAFLALIFALILYGERVNPRLGVKWTIVWLTIPLLLLAGILQTTFIVVFLFIFTRFVIDSVTLGGVMGLRESLRNNTPLFIVFLMSGCLYAIVLVLSQKFAGGLHDDRATLISIADIPSRFEYIALLLKDVIWSGDPILSASVKYALIATIVGFSIVIGIGKPQVAMGYFVLFAVLTASSIFLVSLSKVWWPTPRALYGMGFTYGLVLLAISLGLKKWSKTFLGITLTITLGLIFHSNVMLHDQQRLNRWDLWTAGALAQDLASKGVRQNQKVFLVGIEPTYPAGPKTSLGDFNVSALSAPGYTQSIMQEATGRSWNVAPVSLAEAPGACPPDSYWPSPESIHIRQQEVIVCMGSW